MTGGKIGVGPRGLLGVEALTTAMRVDDHQGRAAELGLGDRRGQRRLALGLGHVTNNDGSHLGTVPNPEPPREPVDGARPVGRRVLFKDRWSSAGNR